MEAEFHKNIIGINEYGLSDFDYLSQGCYYMTGFTKEEYETEQKKINQIYGEDVFFTGENYIVDDEVVLTIIRIDSRYDEMLYINYFISGLGYVQDEYTEYTEIKHGDDIGVRRSGKYFTNRYTVSYCSETNVTESISDNSMCNSGYLYYGNYKYMYLLDEYYDEEYSEKLYFSYE